MQPRQLRRAPAALAGDELVAPVADTAYDDRLDDPLRADRVGQLLQGLGMHIDARLEAAALNEVHRKGPKVLARGSLSALLGLRYTEQRIQPATQTPSLGCHIVLNRSAPEAGSLHRGELFAFLLAAKQLSGQREIGEGAARGLIIQ